MDAFVIISTSGEVLVERYYKNGANRSWFDEYLGKLRKRGPPSTHVTLHPIISVEGRQMIQILRNDVLLLAIQQFPSMLSIETIQRIADDISSHFDEPVSEQLIKSHFSSILALINEMLDFGLPSILEPNALSMLVPQQSPLSQALQMISPTRLMANVMGNGTASTEITGMPGDGMGSGSGMGVGSGILGCGSSVWWRRGSGTSGTNDVFVDLVERVSCIIDRSGRILANYLTGDATINSSLHGIPNFKLILKNSQVLGHHPILSFHPSVSVQKWKQDQTINFIPPDGSFTLFQYSLKHPSLSTPLNVSANFTFSDQTDILKDPLDGSHTSADAKSSGRSGKFEILIQPRPGFGGFSSLGSGADIVLENVRLSVLLPRWITGITTAEVNFGTVKFVDRQKTLTWSFTKFPLDGRQVAKSEGTLNIGEDEKKNTIVDDALSDKSGDDDDEPVVPIPRNEEIESLNLKDLSFPAFLNFWLPHQTLSGLAIDSLEISGAESIANKMVRCATTAGKIEFRL